MYGLGCGVRSAWVVSSLQREGEVEVVEVKRWRKVLAGVGGTEPGGEAAYVFIIGGRWVQIGEAVVTQTG
jgi:hypothetical protein